MGGFWRRPREQRWRGWVFQVHLWTGLLIGAWALTMGLSGSVLVFQHEIEAAFKPELFTVELDSGRASLDAVAAEVGRLYPEYEIVNFRGLELAGRSHIVRIVHRDAPGGLRGQRHVHYDPYTGTILGSYDRRDRFFGFFQELHYYLLLAPFGMQVNSILGAALFAMCVSGLIIWWPGSKNWRRGLMIKRGAGWKRVTYDLHRSTGFYVAAALALMAFTGAYFGFPAATTALLTALTGGDVSAASAFLSVPRSTSSPGAPAYSLDAIVDRTDELLPAGYVLAYLTPPRSPDGVFRLAGRLPGNPVFEGYGGAYVDRSTGMVLGQFDTREQPLGTRLAFMIAPIHFGEWGGLASKTLWVLLGFAPGGLFLTGFAMWWNRLAGKRYRAWWTGGAGYARGARTAPPRSAPAPEAGRRRPTPS